MSDDSLKSDTVHSNRRCSPVTHDEIHKSSSSIRLLVTSVKNTSPHVKRGNGGEGDGRGGLVLVLVSGDTHSWSRSPWADRVEKNPVHFSSLLSSSPPSSHHREPLAGVTNPKSNSLQHRTAYPSLL